MHYHIAMLRGLRCTIGRNIHALRVERRMPLSSLAQMSGIAVSVLDSYELGKYAIRLEELIRIACALEVKPGQLMAE